MTTTMAIPVADADHFDLPIQSNHLLELYASGLSDETIRAAGIKSVESADIAKALGWKPKGIDWGNGWLIPFRTPEGEDTGYCRVKLDFPRHDDDDNGKPIKYEAPPRKPNRVYFPPGIGHALNSGGEIVITEGEKKTLAAMQAGFPTIGLTGVWAWQQARKRDDNGRTYGQRRLLADLAAVRWAGRRVVIVFDSDAAHNRLIQLAEDRLADALRRAGAADVRVGRIPSNGETKVGIDDLLISSGPAALRQVIDAAKPAEAPDCSVGDLARAWLLDAFDDGGEARMRWWRGEFYRWIGRQYVRVDQVELEKIIFGWLDEKTPNARPRLAKEIVEAVAALRRVAFNVEAPAWIDGDTGPEPANIIAVNNGLLDISGAKTAGKLSMLPHRPTWFSETCLPFDFDPAAKCPVWQSFLASSLDPESVDLLQRYFGLLLTPYTGHQKMLLAVGPPRSGKGTICRTIQRVIGPDACTSPTLSGLAGEFGLWPLVGKSVAVLADAHVGKSADAVRVLETIKAIVGEDAVNVNRKYLPPLIGVRLGVRFVVSVNELPHFSDASGAMAARLLILPFMRSFVGQEDRTLEDRLAAETPGILNWAIDGLHRLNRLGGFNTPAAAQSVLDNFQRLSSPIGAFIDDACIVGPNMKAPIDQMYAAWCTWATDAGHNTGAKSLFGERLRAVNPTIERQRLGERGGPRPYYYVGVGLNTDGEALADRAAAAAGGNYQ